MFSSFGRSSIKTRILYLVLGIIIVTFINQFGLLLHFFEVNYNKFSYPLDIPMQEVLAALKMDEKPPYLPINELNYPYRISNIKKCLLSNSNDHEKVVILYVIKSALNNEERRNSIRKSWGWENRFSDVNIKTVFMLGISNDASTQERIDEEYARNKDLVQGEFIDSYYNNTIKTLMGFRWVFQHCPRAQFIMFSDDDMYISTKNLLKFIRNPFNKRVGFRRRRDLKDILRNSQNAQKPKNASDSKKLETNSNERKLMELDPVLSAFDGRLFAGFVFFSSPMRHKLSKWYVTLEEYPYSKYPPYVTAGAYVLSYPALEDLYFTSMYTKHFKFDDVYLGIVAKKCGISPLHNDNFYFWKKPYDKEAYSNVIASHGFGNPDELKSVWEEQRSLGHA